MEIPDKLEISRGFMKDCKASFPRLLSGGVITFTLLLRAAIGQSTSPSGTYGFVAYAYQMDSAGQNGGALVGFQWSGKRKWDPYPQASRPAA